MDLQANGPVHRHLVTMPNGPTRRSDVNEIKDHVTGLFDAYLARDRASLMAGRTPDWMGFQIRSTRLIRGVQAYMDELEVALATLKVDRYEFLDFEVDVDGDLALVHYVARDWLASDDSTVATSRTVLIRALDVYRRIDGFWVQAASNICSVPDPGPTPFTT